MFKNIVNKNVNRVALNYLNKKAEKHSKSKDIIKSDLLREMYIEDKRFSQSDVQLLFQLRTRMVSVKKNFSSLWQPDEMLCRTCDNDEVEKQEHLLVCAGIKKFVYVPEDLKYTDIFSHVDKQLAIVKTFRNILRQREILLNC